MDHDPIEFIASRTFTKTRSDGTEMTWHQEDESAVTSKAEAVGMVQRTIDFWLPMMADQLRARGLSDAVAKHEVRQRFTTTIPAMLRAPFPMRWGITITDLTVPEDWL